MKSRGHFVARPWMLLAGVVLVAAHLILVKRLAYARMPVGVLAGLVLLMIAKHLGVLGTFYGWLRRRSRD